MKYSATAVRCVCVFPTVAVLFSPASAVAELGVVRSLLEIRQDKVVVQQWDMSCGAAALATVLTYQLGDPVSEKQIAHDMLRRTDPMRVKYRGGFSLLDMKRYVEGRGFGADGYARLTLENLRKLAPLIVPVNLDGYDHFVVFRGVTAGRAVLADPAYGNRTLALAEFEKAWNGNIGFVIKPRHQASPANHLSPRKEDLLAVEDEVVRAAMDAEIPKPLEDWQMVDLPWRRRDMDSALAEQDQPADARMSAREAASITAGSPPLVQALNLSQIAPATAMWLTPLVLNASPGATASLTTTLLSPLQTVLTSSVSPSASILLTTTLFSPLRTVQTSSSSPSASVSVSTTGLAPLRTVQTSSSSLSASVSVSTTGLAPLHIAQTSSSSPSASISVSSTALIPLPGTSFSGRQTVVQQSTQVLPTSLRR
jgi:predicted double-glycine peptidase